MRKPIFVILVTGMVLLLIGNACQLFSPAASSGQPAGAEATAVVAEQAPEEEEDATEVPSTEETQPPGESQPPAETQPPANPTPEDVEASTPPGALATSCAQYPCILEGTFILQRPVGGNGRLTADPSNRFGEYQRSLKGANHSITLLNSTGTPVVAAADGEVVLAGDDLNRAYGPYTNYYGNVVILEHNLPGIPVPLYTLYGQLSQVEVSAGDQVQAGDEIGKVGMTGSVSGSTLRFEVRYGENAYGAARNPDLWLRQVTGEDGQLLGAMVGRILDAQGEPVENNNVVVERLEGGRSADQIYLRTYADTRLTGVDPWNESFAIGDLLPGEYKVSFWMNGYQSQVVQVEAGQVTLLEFRLP